MEPQWYILIDQLWVSKEGSGRASASAGRVNGGSLEEVELPRSSSGEQRSPWALARQLWRNRLRWLPWLSSRSWWRASWRRSTPQHPRGPFVSNLNGTTIVNGKKVRGAVGGGTCTWVTPIGPTWGPVHYFLGADSQGRDVMALLLYAGRTSLLIGIGSAAICCFIATILALIAGFFGGTVDALLSRIMDLIWAFPVILLAICIGTELLTSSNGLKFG
jgi:hypothetical protein